MTKHEFLNELEKRLRHMPREDREDALRYYSEYIDDMNLPPDADVSARLGNPKDVAKEIINNCTKKHMDGKGLKEKGKSLWLIILSLFVSPLALPLALAIAAAIVAAVIVIILAVLAVAALVVAGPFLLIFGVIKSIGWLISGIFSIIGAIIIATLVIKVIGWIAKKIAGIF